MPIKYPFGRLKNYPNSLPINFRVFYATINANVYRAR
jgi:hypothetical protein